MSDPTEGQDPAPRGLTQRQRRALGIVLSAATLTEGCKLAGIGRSTWWTWKKDSPAFRRAVAEAEAQTLEEALARLKGGALRAQERLAELLDSKNDGVKLQACTVYLRYAVEAAKLVDSDLRKRVEELAARLGQGGDR